jgi:16S rRNA processing protein RimM
MTRPEREPVAAVTGAHGVRGQVKLKSLVEPPDAVFSLALSDASGSPVRLRRDGRTAKGFIAGIEGVKDRNQAEALKGAQFFAAAEHIPPARTRLDGFAALLPDGTPYGAVIAMHDFGAGEIVEIEKTDGKNEMLPLKAPFVLETRKNDKSLIVSPPDYIEGTP